jgi:hypothetical protein
MSVTHNWFGPLRAKSRLTKSSATSSRLARRHFGRPIAPARPARRMSSSTAP